jgi:hypothetical protein
MEGDVTVQEAVDEAAAAERKKAKKAKKKAAEASATQEQEQLIETTAPVLAEAENPPPPTELEQAAAEEQAQAGEKKVSKKKKKAKDAEAEGATTAPVAEDAAPQPTETATEDPNVTTTSVVEGAPGGGEGEEPVVEKIKKKKKNKSKVDGEEPVAETTTVTDETTVEPSSSSIKIEPPIASSEVAVEPEITASVTLAVSVPKASNDTSNNNSPTEGDSHDNNSSSSSSSSTLTSMGSKPPKPTAPKPTSPKPNISQIASGVDETGGEDSSSRVEAQTNDTKTAKEKEEVVRATNVSSSNQPPADKESAADESSSVASSEDDGISRCGVSGLYDGRGNPAALASGWLQILDRKTGRKRHRYYVLCPKYLAFFASEEHAAINEGGFMLGDADYSTLSMIGNNTGAHISLSLFLSVEADPGDDTNTFTITLSQKDGEGNMAITLVAANHQIALGWAGAVGSQVNSSRTLGKPPNRVKTGPTPMLPEDALAKVAVEASIAVANVVAKSMNSVIKETQRGGFSGLFAQLIGSGKVAGIGAAAGVNEGDKADGDYYAFSTWEEKGINLRDPQYKSCHEDEYGHPAAILHGWVTKRNKTGVFAGNAMKDRYFVLTPAALCFFPDEQSANVRDGYLRGKAQGLKISGVFETIGGKLPLESICEIKLLSRFGESNESKRSVNVRGRGQDDEEEDEEEEEQDGSSASTEAIAKSIAKRMGGGAAPKSKSDPHHNNHHHATDDDDDSVDGRRKLSSGNSSVASSPARKTSNTLVQPIKHPNYDAMREAMLIAECQKRGNVDYEASPAELRQRLLDDDKANANSNSDPEENYDEMEKQALIELCESRGLESHGKAKELRVRLQEDDNSRNSKKSGGAGKKKISNMSDEELKDECLRRDLSIAAKTQELRQRLRDDDVSRAKKAAAEAAAEAKAAAAAAAAAEKASANKASNSDNDDDDDDDEDDDDESNRSGIANKKKPSTAKPPSKKPTGSKPPKPPAGKPSAPPPSNLVEVDFGDFSLIFNAHNTKCRTSWVTQLRQWSAWRKRKLDDELFAGKDEVE